LRFNEDGSPNQEFVLNRPEYKEATILVSGRNFGCGSSREHAPWALLDYGIRAVIAPSFADIFHKNCFDNGIVPILLDENTVSAIIQQSQESPGYQLTVDLETCQLKGVGGFETRFIVHNDLSTHEFRRHCLLEGLDDIGLTLQHEDKISEFENRR
jgi:3-isopropylmalate/(R)-2-methylmalate dehydratase small subunit